MVGLGTALADDPALTVRLPGVDLKPLRVVLDTHLRLPARSRLAATARDIPTLVIAGPDEPTRGAERFADLGVAIERIGVDAKGGVDLGQALRALSARGITRVFSEGGPRVAARLIATGLADDGRPHQRGKAARPAWRPRAQRGSASGAVGSVALPSP